MIEKTKWKFVYIVKFINIKINEIIPIVNINYFFIIVPGMFWMWVKWRVIGIGKRMFEIVSSFEDMRRKDLFVVGIVQHRICTI